REVISGELDHRHAAVVVEAERALVGALLLRLLQVKNAAEIEREREDVALDFGADGLQLLEILFLQGAHFRTFDFGGSENLRSGKARDSGHDERGQPTSTFARKQSPGLRKEDQKPSECRR